MAPDSRAHLERDNADLRSRLAEAQEALRALASGEVDALVIPGPDGDQVFTLRGADEAYRVMVEGMAEGAVTLTRDGLIVFANEQFASLVQMPLERVIGRSFAEFVADADAEISAELLKAKQDWKAELRLRADDLALIPVYVSIQSLTLNAQESLCLIVTDLSEQKRNQEIIASEKLARSILEQSAEAIIVVDPGGKMTHASRATEHLAGRPVLQHHFDDVFKVSYESGEALSIDKILSLTKANGILKNVDVVARLIDGRKVDALLSSAILTASNATLLGCVIHITDITDRKRANLEIKNHAAELARANEDLVHFAYAVSHDLHAPLRNITSFSQILMRQYKPKFDDKGEKMIDSIVQAARRMDAMLHDLLQFVTIAGSEVQIDQAVPLEAILTDALKNLSTAIEECAATITHDPLPAAHIDRSQFVQLFQNLIGNSLKYCKPGARPQVHVSAQPRGAEWVVAVRDNGVGFDNKHRDKIFGVFQRLNNAERTGTGIGLTICKRIVERHGGRIWAESQPGEGAVFSFSIPAQR